MIHRVVLTSSEIVTALTRFAIDKSGVLSAAARGVELDRKDGAWQATVAFEPVPVVVGGNKP